MDQSTRPEDPRTAAQARALDERYGRSRPRARRVLVVATVLVAVLGLAWVAWATWFQSTPQVQSALTSYEVRGPHTVAARIRVRTHTAGVRANCLLRASGEDHTVVGERNLVLREPKGSVDVSLTFRTEREATTVDLVGCTTADQARPR